MVEQEKLKDYYEKTDLWLPTHPKERIFKFELNNGKVIQIKDIHNIKDLREQLLKYLPVSVWYSISCYNQKRWVYADLCFDVDCKERELKEAKSLAFWLAVQLQDKFKLKYCLFSGDSFCLVYQCKDIKNIKSCIKHRIALVEELKKQKRLKDIDYRLTINPMKFIRLPQTIHTNGTIAQIIPIKKLVDRAKVTFISNIQQTPMGVC